MYLSNPRRMRLLAVSSTAPSHLAEMYDVWSIYQGPSSFSPVKYEIYEDRGHYIGENHEVQWPDLRRIPGTSFVLETQRGFSSKVRHGRYGLVRTDAPTSRCTFMKCSKGTTACIIVTLSLTSHPKDRVCRESWCRVGNAVSRPPPGRVGSGRVVCLRCALALISCRRLWTTSSP